MQEYFEIGQIVNTSGLKGFVKANMFTDVIDKIESFDKVLIEKKGHLIEYEIEEVKYHKNQVIIKFKGVDDINQAEILRNCYIKVNRNDEEALPEDTYYIVDLIGLNVISDEGEKIGVLKDVFSIPSGEHDIYVVETESQDVLLPAISEVVKKIDLENQEMIIHLIDGLI